MEKFCEYSNTFQMDLDEMYNQILNTKKQKNVIANKNDKKAEAEQIKEEIYDLKNLSIFTEVVVFSKFHLDWYMANFKLIFRIKSKVSNFRRPNF